MYISGSPALPVFQVEFSPEVLPGRNDRITLVNFDPETDERGEPEGAEINFCNCYGGQYGPYRDFDKGGNVALIALKSGVVGEYFATEVETKTLLAEALKSLLDWGLTDSLRLHTEEAGLYSWWDFRAAMFRRGLGLRIDLILVTPSLAERCRSVDIDKRARGGEKPSDHAPVLATFE